MDPGFLIAVCAAFAFALTNGFHDASNAIATLVATRGATPRQAVLLAAACTMLGPLLLGSAVADTIGGIVTLGGAQTVQVIGSGLLAAVAWNLATWWFGLPSSSGHALIGGLVGAGLLAGGFDSVYWGGLDGWRPVGVFGTLIALAVSPLLGGLVAIAAIRGLRRAAQRATRRWEGPTRAGQWGMSGALALSHGANDAQKSVGVIAALLIADGHASTLSGPLWATLGCGVAITLGTAMGGWRIVRTVGQRIVRLHPLEGLASQTASSGVILGASMLGAPVSTTQVVVSSVVGVGEGRRRQHHVHWGVVRRMALAWVTTIPATAALAAVCFEIWRSVG